VLFYLTPVWATLFAYVALSERVGLGRWLAILGTRMFVGLTEKAAES
jgi:drug/metabolite transporter (DMT)-like permease